MIQRVLTFLILALLLSAECALAEPAPPLKTAVKKSPEAIFMEGLACLKQQDVTCAQLAMNMIPSPSPYAKLLDGNIAASTGDFDRAFRLLLPLQAASDLIPQASASLHTSLARAYENQSDAPRALEQYVLAETDLAEATEIESNRQNLWQLLKALPREQLVDMRGESENTIIQGWIDLALAIADNDQAVSAWRKAYTDHPATNLLNQLPTKITPLADTKTTQNISAPTNGIANSTGPIALLLPQDPELPDTAIEALRSGFLVAQSIAKDQAEVRIYSANGQSNDVYTLATNEGARYIVDMTQHAPQESEPVKHDASLAFTTLHAPSPGQNKDIPVLKFGLTAQTEAEQLVKITRNYGMQTATIVSGKNASANRMAQIFKQLWIAAGGQIRLQIGLLADTDPSDIKARITALPADMIVLATTAEEARAIRPYLDLATPTFGFSSIYSGIPRQAIDMPLFTVRFVDTPWRILPDASAFEPYRAAASLLTTDAQRWYALGVDAYLLLTKIIQNPGQAILLNGLSGKIHANADGQISRELSLAIFSKEGVVLEPTP